MSSAHLVRRDRERFTLGFKEPRHPELTRFLAGPTPVGALPLICRSGWMGPTSGGVS